MDTQGPAGFPLRLPEVHIEPVATSTAERVTCDELPWWFVIPREGEVSAAGWYDRATSMLTSVRETVEPVAAIPGRDGEVAIAIDEWTPGTGAASDWGRRRIEMTARLGPERAEFLSVTMDGNLTDATDPHFARSWGDTGSRVITDSGRLVAEGPRAYRSRQDSGRSAEVVELTVDGTAFRCLRVLDLEPGSEPDEIGQPIIDLDSGRTLAYWQYRPPLWDADSSAWLEAHPQEGITLDGVDFQRRSCTGRDEIALTDIALAER
ncbi:hypothetical protein [Brachybacterium sp. FME24]|uniref:hypothetical protein n=1 Tax=Brachybacterium sp. FME24 TaxID=2742605 RepID=UPI001865BBB0|nr:hypothetical protein [Brachybacterium sp. FME24]